MVGGKELEAAQAALLARYAPDTRVRRVRWSRGETQVLELGDGPPLLLVHGGGDAAFEWIPILPQLARTHRVLAVDRPGHGLADPFDYRGVDLLEHAPRFLREILDALDARAADIAANSIGGLWAVLLALASPDRVSRLALVGAPPGADRAAPLPLRLFGLPVLGKPLGRRLLSKPTREGSRTFWGQLLVAHPERLDDALLDADVAHMRRNVNSVVGLLNKVVGPGGLRRRVVLGEQWQALQVPTMLLLGERDAFVTPATRAAWEAIAARNPAIRLTTVPDAGHLPWIDEPRLVVAELERFFAHTPSEQRRTA